MRGILFLCLNLLALFFAFSTCFQNCPFVQRDVVSQQLAQAGKESDLNSVLVDAVPSGSSASPSFSSLNGFQYQISRDSTYGASLNPFLSLSSDGSFRKETVVCKSSSFTFSKKVSMVTLSTFTNSKKLESLNLELLSARSDERKTFLGSDSYVYISNILADAIIEASQSDLLVDYDSLMNSDYCVSVVDGEKAVQRTYRIANVFYINGFTYASKDEKYKKSDSQNGEKLFSFLEDFIITPDTVFFNYVPFKMCFLSFTSEFALKQIGELFFSKVGKGGVLSRAFVFSNGVAVEQSQGDKISSLYYVNCSSFGGLSAMPLVFFLCLIPPFLAVYFSMRKKKQIGYFQHLCLLICPFFWLLVSHFIQLYVSSFALCCFFSVLSNGFVASVLVICFCLTIFHRRARHV